MSFIKRSLFIGTILFIGVLLFAASRPDTFVIERSIDIQAPPQVIYPLINDLHNFPLWSPYDNVDPAMRRSFSGAPNGQGAVYAWQGNAQVGSGRLEIIEAIPYSRVVMTLDYVEPIVAHNMSEFTLQPSGNQTKVTWRMHGPAPFLSKVMSLFFSIDNTIGPQFELGLANLRRLTDKQAQLR